MCVSAIGTGVRRTALSRKVEELRTLPAHLWLCYVNQSQELPEIARSWVSVPVCVRSRDWEVFRKRHWSDTAVHWPGQPDPTLGRDAHQVESEAFFKSIENHLDNNPYKVTFASGDWTCTIAKWTGR